MCFAFPHYAPPWKPVHRNETCKRAPIYCNLGTILFMGLEFDYDYGVILFQPINYQHVMSPEHSTYAINIGALLRHNFNHNLTRHITLRHVITISSLNQKRTFGAYLHMYAIYDVRACANYDVHACAIYDVRVRAIYDVRACAIYDVRACAILARAHNFNQSALDMSSRDDTWRASSPSSYLHANRVHLAPIILLPCFEINFTISRKS